MAHDAHHHGHQHASHDAHHEPDDNTLARRHGITRRVFVQSGALALLALGLPPAFFPRTLAAQLKGASRRKTLICVFQRGAVDGLNMVVPYGERAYYAMRPNIAIPTPGRAGGALDLDGFFGFHPALAPLHDLYGDRALAVLHAVASPHPTRSHFEAQAYMETADPGNASAREGWLNRVLQATANPEQGRTLDDAAAHARDHAGGQMGMADLDFVPALRGVAVSSALPLALQGSHPTLALQDPENPGIGARAQRGGGMADGGMAGGGMAGAQGRAQASALEESFARLYRSEGNEVLGRTGDDTFRALEVLRKVDPTRYRASADANYPQDAFGESLRRIAQLVKADVGVEVAFADLGGWDTHRGQGGSEGEMARRLDVFARGIRALHTDLGTLMDDVVILTMSEFGRTARENGARGTDHGHANCMLALGGDVQGGRILGDWPGLEPELLNQGRDLARTTDFRDVFSEVVARHLGAERLEAIFPGHAPDASRWRGILG